MLRSIAQIPNSLRLDHLNEAFGTESVRIQSPGSSTRIGFKRRVCSAVPGEQTIGVVRVYPETRLGVAGLNGLLRVAVCAGVALAWAVDQFPGAKVLMPEPPEWNGSAPKEATANRVMRLLPTLEGISPRFRPHVLDAAGMALWAASASQERREARSTILASARARAKRAKR